MFIKLGSEQSAKPHKNLLQKKNEIQLLPLGEKIVNNKAMSSDKANRLTSRNR